MRPIRQGSSEARHSKDTARTIPSYSSYSSFVRLRLICATVTMASLDPLQGPMPRTVGVSSEAREDEMRLIPTGNLIHPKYLPFTEQQLADHFLPGADVAAHLAYYRASAERAAALEANPPTGTSAQIRRAIRLGRQMERDEKFWVAATLMHLFHAPNPVTLLAETMQNCLGNTPPDSLPRWKQHLARSSPCTSKRASLHRPPTVPGSQASLTSVSSSPTCGKQPSGAETSLRVRRWPMPC